VDSPKAAGLRIVRVRCDVPPTMLGPLFEARRKVELILDQKTPLLEQARERMVAGLRRRLLGDLPVVGSEGPLVEVWNRLAELSASDRPSVLVFDAVDAADEATLDGLQRILNRPGWLRLPLLLVFRTSEPSGAARALLDTLTAVEGSEAVLCTSAPPPSTSGAAPEKPPLDLRALPPEVLRVLRAGALIGTGFEADLVALLLDQPALYVLDCLQGAADAGVPLEDNGEGRFHMAEPLVDALRASILPSLAVAWHRRLAVLLSGAAAPIEALANPPVPTDFAVTLRPGAREEGASADEFVKEPAPRTPPIPPPPPDATLPDTTLPEAVSPHPEAVEEALPEEIVSPEPAWPYEEIFSTADTLPRPGVEPAPEPEATPTPAAQAAPTYAPPTPKTALSEEAEPRRTRRPEGRAEARREAQSPWEMAPLDDMRTSPMASSLPAPQGDEARAAGHLLAAGEPEAGAERYFAACKQAAAMGAYMQAIAYGQRALALLEGLPPSPRRRRLRIRVMVELGRLQWQAAGPEPAFTLAGALEVLDAARAEVAVDDPPALQAELAALIAGVCYDLGDMRSLERALDELTQASRMLLAAGDAKGAARLLNDTAAVYVRAGDPVRAAHLLSESRKIFEEKAQADPVALVEMAETDHLFARIPLHVAARPGRESDAMTMGIDHALAAERTYRKLGAMRELGRVWETLGRLELCKGRLDRATSRLTEAIRVQESLGDIVGLARSTAALSEVLSASGQHREALGLLGDSVVLNLEKGSPIGLAFNRRALEAIDAAAPSDRETRALFDAVRERLTAAESVLGRVVLPGVSS